MYILEDSELEIQYFNLQKAHKIYNFLINMYIAHKEILAGVLGECCLLP